MCARWGGHGFGEVLCVWRMAFKMRDRKLADAVDICFCREWGHQQNTQSLNIMWLGPACARPDPLIKGFNASLPLGRKSTRCTGSKAICQEFYWGTTPIGGLRLRRDNYHSGLGSVTRPRHIQKIQSYTVPLLEVFPRWNEEAAFLNYFSDSNFIKTAASRFKKFFFFPTN